MLEKVGQINFFGNKNKILRENVGKIHIYQNFFEWIRWTKWIHRANSHLIGTIHIQRNSFNKQRKRAKEVFVIISFVWKERGNQVVSESLPCLSVSMDDTKRKIEVRAVCLLERPSNKETSWGVRVVELCPSSLAKCSWYDLVNTNVSREIYVRRFAAEGTSIANRSTVDFDRVFNGLCSSEKRTKDCENRAQEKLQLSSKNLAYRNRQIRSFNRSIVGSRFIETNPFFSTFSRTKMLGHQFSDAKLKEKRKGPNLTANLTNSNDFFRTNCSKTVETC